jgi:hypothetical protein
MCAGKSKNSETINHINVQEVSECFGISDFKHRCASYLKSFVFHYFSPCICACTSLLRRFAAFRTPLSKTMKPTPVTMANHHHKELNCLPVTSGDKATNDRNIPMAMRPPPMNIRRSESNFAGFLGCFTAGDYK